MLTVYTGSFSDGDEVTCILTSNAICANPSKDTSNSETVSIIAPVTPSVSITSQPQGAVCPGTSITFTASAVNGGNNTQYNWKLNGLFVGNNSSSYTSTTLVNGDSLVCVMTNNDGCTTTSTATSNNAVVLISNVITPTISINVSPNDTVCRGTSVIFTSATSGGGTSPTYTWKVNGNTVGGNTSTFTTDTLNNNDVVSCQLSSSESCASPSTASSNNLSAIIVDITTTVNTTGGGETLTATESGAQYQWLTCPGKLPINGATLQSFTPVSSGSYACVISKNGCSDTSTCNEVIISNVISIQDELSATVYPNPCSDMLIIDIHNDALFNGSIYDLTGRLVSRISLHQGKNMFSFTGNGLEDGVYVLFLESEFLTRTYRLIHAK